MMNKIQILIIVVLIPIGFLYWYSTSKNIPVREIFFPGTPVMHIGEIPLRVEIANSEEERKTGLSGRKELEGVNGLLFVFPEAGYHSMWMKDMSFPIDIIWISEDLKVIGIDESVSPDTYPRVFRPSEPARFAVETNVHFSDTFGLRVGHKVRMPQRYLED